MYPGTWELFRNSIENYQRILRDPLFLQKGNAMIYRKTVCVSPELAAKIQTCLTTEPASENDCLSEDEILCVTAKFPDGIEMDVKCCGVQYREGESNTAWTEAVLFQYGCELCHTDVCDEFLGEWELSYGDDTYIATVVIVRDV